MQFKRVSPTNCVIPIASIFMKRIFVLLFTVTLTSCWDRDNDYEFEYEIIVTDIPVNLEGINSSYDDYNSDLPYPAGGLGIYFSSNRQSGGTHFDIIHKNFGLSYHVKDDVLDVHYTSNEYGSYENKLLPLINSDGDELGPFSFFGPEEYTYFFYADNQDGNFDIKYAHSLKSDFGTWNAKEVINGPENLELINSERDDLYPAINDDQTQLLFCSNRDHDYFNIYNILLPAEAALHGFLGSGGPGEITVDPVLSSDDNDKCPSIKDDLLVFASDREGGYGGFDLYYSHQEDGTWTTPLNFGPVINSEHDEYRPITFPFHDFKHVMIFSSNKPEGKGGFDLYIVKVDKAIKPPVSE